MSYCDRCAEYEDEIKQLKADLERHESQIRHYPDSYLGKIFFRGVECGRKQLEERVRELEDKNERLQTLRRTLEIENEQFRFALNMRQKTSRR